MDGIFWNPIKVRHYGTKVQDNLMSDDTLSIITEENEFFVEIAMEGTILHYGIHYPSDNG